MLKKDFNSEIKPQFNDYDIDRGNLDYLSKKYENDRYQQDTQSRKKLSLWAKKVIATYLTYVAVILLFNFSYLHLSDAVLTTLLGITTLNVLGLMYIVLKGYFAAKR